MQRRNFLKLSAAGVAAAMFNNLTYASVAGAVINLPDEAWVNINGEWTKIAGNGHRFTGNDAVIDVVTNGSSQSVYLRAPNSEPLAIRLKWIYQTKKYIKTLGDTWERSYTDLGWKATDAAAINPWYVMLYDGAHTAAFGVKTGCNTMCWWAVKEDGIELTLNCQSGGMGVKLGDRKLHAADIVTTLSKTGETPYATTTRFCKQMCPKPRLPKQPVYGINDWYVVYGKNSFQTIKDQTAAMAEFVTSTTNQPFSVIDDGWQQPDDFSIVNDKFKDMHKMADEIKSHGMRPGLWTRPLIARNDDKKSLLTPRIKWTDQTDGLILDPTIPENLERIKRNLRLYKEWGYHMVKHDYSSFDIFGRWGMQMKDVFTTTGWAFNDRSKTNAEIINTLYGTIREAAGDMYIIGCNTMSHLSAGVFELDRIGDDTSGREWKRTKEYGVNTMGFRLPQHNTFYAADGDCVGLTKDVPWEKNKQWLQLLAESGAPLFISAELETLTADKKAAIKTAFAQAAKVQPTGEPLDWLTNPLPAKWKLNHRTVTFNWD